MKLGSQTGSVTNHLLSRAVIGQPEPHDGMGATILLWSDRHAATIVKVWGTKADPKCCVSVRQDTAKVVSGSTHDGSAEYAYSPNPNGPESHYRRDANGQWRQIRWNEKTKRWNRMSGGRGLRIGSREEYRDPCF